MLVKRINLYKCKNGHSLTRILERECIKMIKWDMQGVPSGNVNCLQVNAIPKVQGFNIRISPCFTGGQTDSREGQNKQFTAYGRAGSGAEVM